MDAERLDAVAREFVNTVPTALAARIHAFVVQEFKDADELLPAKAATDDSPLLLAVNADRTVSTCSVDGTSVAVVSFGKLRGARLTANYELSETRAVERASTLRSWTLWHPNLPEGPGTLTINAGLLSHDEDVRIAAVLKRLLDD